MYRRSLLLLFVLSVSISAAAQAAPKPSPRPDRTDVDLPTAPVATTSAATDPQPLICGDNASTAFLKAQNESLWKSLELLMDEDSRANEKKYETDKSLNVPQTLARRVELLRTLLKAKKPQ